MNPNTLQRLENELARREAAAGAEAQPSNLHQYKAALANYEQMINDERRKNEKLATRVEALERALATQAALLERLQWVSDCDGAPFCPECAGQQRRGHYDGCAVAAAIAAAKEAINAK